MKDKEQIKNEKFTTVMDSGKRAAGDFRGPGAAGAETRRTGAQTGV
jgi:hypothetical protein